jgi:hypothetical protein
MPAATKSTYVADTYTSATTVLQDRYVAATFQQLLQDRYVAATNQQLPQEQVCTVAATSAATKRS